MIASICKQLDLSWISAWLIQTTTDYKPVFFQACKGASLTASGVDSSSVDSFGFGFVIAPSNIIAGLAISWTKHYRPQLWLSFCFVMIAAGLLSTLHTDSSCAKSIGFEALMGVGIRILSTATYFPALAESLWRSLPSRNADSVRSHPADSDASRPNHNINTGSICQCPCSDVTSYDWHRCAEPYHQSGDEAHVAAFGHKWKVGCRWEWRWNPIAENWVETQLTWVSCNHCIWIPLISQTFPCSGQGVVSSHHLNQDFRAFFMNFALTLCDQSKIGIVTHLDEHGAHTCCLDLHSRGNSG